MTLTPRTLARLAAASEVADMVERASEDADEYMLAAALDMHIKALRLARDTLPEETR